MMMEKVPSISPGSTVSTSLPSYIAFFLVLQAHRLTSAQFTVAGRDLPISASVGGEASLPCHLVPEMSAEKMEVRWRRAQSSTVVHVYRDGMEQSGEQTPEYQGRTEFVKDDIANGRVSLRILNIQPMDDGQYTCLFQSGNFSKEAALELQVAALGSAPAISVERGYHYNEIRVVCQSSGWYPHPEVRWRNSQRELLQSASENTSPVASGLFQTVVATVVREESNQKVSCHVRNPRLNQEKESHISVSGPLFPSNSRRRSELESGVAVLAVLLVLLIVLVVVLHLWRKRSTGHLRTENENLLGGKNVLQDEKNQLQTKNDKLQTEIDQLETENKKLQAEIGWIITKTFAVDVTLDPGTAHPDLMVPEDWKSVRYRGKHQDLPKNHEGFDTCPSVLGAEGFMSGRHYWEVEVGDSTGWILGVCRESVSRRESVTLSPGNGYWAVWLRDGEYKALSTPPTPLPVSVRPSRVGIFLDYELGEVSFYNVTDRSLLFTFTDTFSGMLSPYFSPCLDAKNLCSLIICPITAQAGENICL